MDSDGHDLEGFFTKLTNLHNLRVEAHKISAGAVDSGSRFVLSEEMIKLFHRICMTKLLKEAGEYRQIAVALNGSNHIPPHYSEVPIHMMQLCRYINDEWDNKNPVHLAAFFLWRLNWIHPFVNGNGRISRELSYTILNVKCDKILPSKNSIVEQISNNSSTRDAYNKSLRDADRLYAATNSFDICIRPVETLIGTLLKEQLKANLK